MPEENPTTTTQRATIENQVLLPPPPPPLLFNTLLIVPVNHILPNLSAWTIPTAINNHSTQPSPHLPSSELIQMTTTNATSSSALVQPVSVMPVTCKVTVYYVPPPVVATPVVGGTTTQPSSLLTRASAAPFVPLLLP